MHSLRYVHLTNKLYNHWFKRLLTLFVCNYPHYEKTTLKYVTVELFKTSRVNSLHKKEVHIRVETL